ncbi:MAG TPA: hypothetical protein VJL87_01795 [Bdellovibrionota bacterium]|nr:hypothetical protein [Bdellovibrionota bacterium]
METKGNSTSPPAQRALGVSPDRFPTWQSHLFLFFTILFSSLSFAQEPQQIPPTPTEQQQPIATQPTPTKELQPKEILSAEFPKAPKEGDILILARGKSPRDVVQLFFALDLAGDRISGKPERIFKLTNWEKPLDWDLYMVVDKWGIVEEKKVGDKSLVKVQFQLKGRVIKDFLIVEPDLENLEFLLAYNPKKKIWEIISSQMAPHVARNAVPAGVKEISIQENNGSKPSKPEGGVGAHK